MLKNIKYILLGFIALGVFSCSDDFVDVVSEDPIASEFFKNEQEYEDALIGAYDLLQASFWNVMVGIIASDNAVAVGDGPGDQPQIQQIDEMRHTPFNSTLDAIWGYMYAGVGRTNFILQNRDKGSFPSKNALLAEAEFLRAYYYFELVKWFGDVPLIIDRTLELNEAFSIDRTAKGTVYAAIENDLINAIANLPVTQSTPGRATQGAAQALLGKVYLYQNKFMEAATVLDAAVAGPYSLTTDFGSIFESEGENNKESVFEIQYSDGEGGDFNCLQCSEGNITVGFGSIRGYSEPAIKANGVAQNPDEPVFFTGFGLYMLTPETEDLFDNEDRRKEVTILDIEVWGPTREANFDVLHPAKNTGLYNRKYLSRTDYAQIQTVQLTNPNNYRAIRFSDVLLMAAEAHNRKAAPDDATARLYLNRVRARANVRGITSSGLDLTNDIYKERRLELMGEGHHFFDLVRTNRAAQKIPGFVVGKHEVFPIPLRQLELTGGRWEQNSGYN